MIGNRVVGAIVLSPTDAVSQQVAVGTLIVARAWAPRDTAVHHCFEYFGSEHPDFELAYAPIDPDGQVKTLLNG